MTAVIVLVMHGQPPRDFPREEMVELFVLHERIGQAKGGERARLQQRHDALEEKMRHWPRTPENDAFFYGSQDLGLALSEATGLEVLVCFNEYCAPGIDVTLDEAVRRGAGKVVVTTPMMTRGGTHSEKDIVRAISRAQGRHPAVPIVYAWPFDTAAVARFLAEHLGPFAR